jgi:hypothetical protein
VEGKEGIAEKQRKLATPSTQRSKCPLKRLHGTELKREPSHDLKRSKAEGYKSSSVDRRQHGAGTREKVG